MDIYEKIDIMFSGEAEDKPKWADELFIEIQEIKSLLYELKNTKATDTRVTKNTDREYYNFVKQFRVNLSPDLRNNIYPTYHYQDLKLGVDSNGLLYNKETTKVLLRYEAFDAYKFAYNNQNSIQISA
ncbi:MAG: hypothetical protein Q9M43_07025 [Sulfurimonas sp.]|nr:hypothetical protein [Sulfurimonas sp.]